MKFILCIVLYHALASSHVHLVEEKLFFTYFLGGANGGVGVNFNRYSYTPGANSERPLRHWYEDSHLY